MKGSSGPIRVLDTTLKLGRRRLEAIQRADETKAPASLSKKSLPDPRSFSSSFVCVHARRTSRRERSDDARDGLSGMFSDRGKLFGSSLISLLIARGSTQTFRLSFCCALASELSNVLLSCVSTRFSSAQLSTTLSVGFRACRGIRLPLLPTSSARSLERLVLVSEADLGRKEAF